MLRAGAIAVWLLCCVAALFLPWPGTVLLVMLPCCVASFEVGAWITGGARRSAAGAANSTKQKNNATTTPIAEEAAAAAAGEAPEAAALDISPRRGRASMVTNALRLVADSLRRRFGGGRGGGRDDMEELPAASAKAGVGAENSEQAAAKKTPVAGVQPAATFLKGSLGSFSRGGLMVTHDGRVVYKVNQDRGLISHPSLNAARHTIFGVFDGHGANGEHVAAYTMREVPRRMALHPDSLDDPVRALEDVFVEINASLPASGINAFFGGCTAVVALVRGPKVWVANAGDSRALVAGRGENGGIVARGLTRDQNPDSPGERDRIESMGGFVSDPEEVGASARVWLDATRTMVGLAMARSIGDLAVKRVGVIALPEVTEYELAPEDEFLVLATDGVWEFIDNQEAAEVVHDLLRAGEDAAGACKGLMELANRRWSSLVGDYRDDITATVVLLPFLPPAATAIATAANASSDLRRAASAQAAAAASVSVSAASERGPSSLPAGEESESATTADLSPPPAIPTADGDSMAPGVVVVATDEPSEATPAPVSPTAKMKPDAGAASALASAIPSMAGGGDRSGAVGAAGAKTAAGVSAAEKEKKPDGATVSSGDGSSTAHFVATPAAVTGGVGERSTPGVDAEVPADAGSALAADDDEALTSTPSVTPEGVSEEDVGEFDEGVGGGGEVVAEGEGKGDGEDETLKLLSALSQALVGNMKGAQQARAPSPSALPAASELAASEPTMPLTPAMLPPEAMATGASGKAKAVEIQSEGEGEREGAEGSEEEDEDWEWDIGARENREPSREIREASREFPSGSLGAFVSGI